MTYLNRILHVMMAETPIISFIREILRRQKCLPNKLAADIDVSHATVSRWLAGKDVPTTQSCRKLAEYSGVSFQKILHIAGHLPELEEEEPAKWPEFREYLYRKYPNELDEDLITIIEDLIERRKSRKMHGKDH
jgi:transcriptional regulator with XRE-family HTH domain